MGSDLNLKLDFGVRDNKTSLRRIDEDNNQVSAGSMQYTLNFSADYMLSQSLATCEHIITGQVIILMFLHNFQMPQQVPDLLSGLTLHSKLIF